MNDQIKLRATSDVATYPALIVRRIEPERTRLYRTDGGSAIYAMHVQDGDLLVTPAHLAQYRVGTVVSYAMRNGECPIESIDHARALGAPTNLGD